MKSKKIIAIVAVVGILGAALATTALADSVFKHSITCPECGAEIEMEKKPMRGEGHMMPKPAEELKEELDEKVAAGEMTQEEADKLLAEMEERQSEMEEKIKQREAELEEKLASGEITEEEITEMQAPPKGGRGRYPMPGANVLGEKEMIGEGTVTE